MLALHARRSALSIAAWAASRASSPACTPGLAVVLTGTDLYRDIHTDAQAQRSLQLAQRLVVLQEQAPEALPAELRGKATVIFQSCTGRQTLPKSQARLRAVMVGHLRDEKSPETLFAAARLLTPQDGILIDHIGEPLDPLLGAQAQAVACDCGHYRWLGGQPHEATRKRIQRAHLLVHTSRMEGGAHVVMEAVRAGTPVLASRIAGNVGMLGTGYAGYFDWGDAAQLARLLRRCATPTDALYAQLQAQCEQRATLFTPATEKAALLHLVGGLSCALPFLEN
jgi:putative glycosyltransferase (TIGR04348 family)